MSTDKPTIPPTASAAPYRPTTVLVAGARGMVGSALVRRLQRGGYTRVLAPLRSELDLLDAQAVQAYLAE
ncbi:MAG: NAD-dependent epimerase/dehydratase family protein, partial [Burkholderiaceae bacterium]|nr:NAD-dependent epimerase/dehydratase family protein [Burkholderiaceae bacterium]